MSLKTVLVVDDSELVLAAVRMALEEAGYSVSTTSSPLEVPGLIRQMLPNLVLLDVSMPVLNGDRVVRVVRSFGSVPNTKILLYSDRDVDELHRIAERCEADGYLQKTSDFDYLVNEVQRQIGYP